ncbi:MAG: recombination protein RecR [Micavibrio sp.]|nr:MAG: recombination protein RecR [Micavibrio sp.]
MIGKEIDTLIHLLSKLPGIGPRSARRLALQMLKQKDSLILPLSEALQNAAKTVKTCEVCCNLDTVSPCGICSDTAREDGAICVVEQIGDLWALERTRAYRGRYHVLGGTLSALDNVGPEDLSIPALTRRAKDENVQEIIIALNATVDGQTTAHYLIDRLQYCNVKVTRLAHGVPVGGALDYLDDGTLITALKARSALA